MDYHRLGLGNASSLIRSIRLLDWGANVLIDCIYDPLGERKSYQLSFRGCSQLRIDIMLDAPVQEQEADLLGISLGQENGRQPAILTTDLFEMYVVYQQFQCIKPGQAAAVSTRAESVAAAERPRGSEARK
jgi:hypothetical protein